jgi:hypothetical protein
MDFMKKIAYELCIWVLDFYLLAGNEALSSITER